MEFAALLGLLLLLYLLIAPWVALLRASDARNRVESVEQAQEVHGSSVAELRSQILALRDQQRTLALKLAGLERALGPAGATDGHTTPQPQSQRASPATQPVATAQPPAADGLTTSAAPQTSSQPAAPAEPVRELFDVLDRAIEPLSKPPAAVDSAGVPPPVPPRVPAPAAVPNSPRVSLERTAAAPGATPASASMPSRASRQAALAWRERTASAPAEPGLVEQWISRGISAARDWLFGGNLVARIGLIILFIGVAFLLRLTAAYVTVPIELRLAGIAAGATALLLWGWRISSKRRGIGLPVQGAALAILMLVVFGAFKIWDLLPATPTFALLLVLVAFTCVLAVLQDALWLALFGIVGGFAVPIALASGSGNHVALFTYYAILNAGVLVIALRRSWRVLNVLGFLFTFLIGSVWGVQRYVPEHYASAQGFLILFTLFYIAIAILYAWRRAPRLLSYVDGTLVFGVPMLAMGLQFGLIRHIEYGMSFSALALGLLYATLAMVLWRLRRENLRLLVESFFALAVVFGTLAIPLAFDGRWTSAVWALEGAGIIWVGLRQNQALAWRFGILVQVGSWIALLRSLSGIRISEILQHNLALGFALLGVSALFVGLLLRRFSKRDDAALVAAQPGAGLATGFMLVAVGWLLAALWVDVWFRLDGGERAGMLVLTAIALVLGLQWLGRRAEWKVPELLGGAVAAIAGVTFLVLMARYMDWYTVARERYASLGQLLADGPLMGGLLLCAGALVSAFAFKRRAGLQAADELDSGSMRRAAVWWWAIAVFWWCGFALNGLAHALSWLTQGAVDLPQPWYSISFDAAYVMGLAISAWAWSALALRYRFPARQRIQTLFWPGLTAVALMLFVLAVRSHLEVAQTLLLGHPASAAIWPAWQALLGGPLSGGILLCLLMVIGMRRLLVGSTQGDIDSHPEPSSAQLHIWLLGLGIAWYLLVVDPLAVFSARLTAGSRWEFGYAEMQLLWVALSAVLFVGLAASSRWRTLAWLGLPAAVLQALVSVVVLLMLYQQERLPTAPVGIALLVVWLAVVWCLRAAMKVQDMAPGSVALAWLHWGRVIAPWLMLPAMVALLSRPWLLAVDTAQVGQVAQIPNLAPHWPDYLGLWCGIGVLFLLLRQCRAAAWPVAPLQQLYLRLWLPLVSAALVWLLLRWNIAHDGTMTPLPYLPLLNPLDLSSALVALLVALVWRENSSTVGPGVRRWIFRGCALLAYAWFNLMLLRTAAHYLGLPYRFEPLYASQFVQAMLSLVWTASAFLLMRYAVGRLSKPLWMVGAAVLAIVVFKLFLVDLSNVGSVARIVSFMGVGGSMLLIGYLAPLPRSAGGSDPDEREPGKQSERRP